jgi:signal transduction histidine kinase
MMIPLLVQLLRPALKKWLNIHMEAMSRTNLAIYALLISFFMVNVAATFGFRKEQDRVSLWANRLSIDRDITLELELRTVENEIASDVLIASLSMLDNTNSVVLNRIMDYYMGRLSQDYDVSVFILNQDNVTPQAVDYVNSRMEDGKPIFDNSRFVYSTTSKGHSRYAALFTFYAGELGPSNMLLEVEPKANKEDRGFSSLLGYTSPGRVTIPAQYSYAKYESGMLTSYRGSYPYVRTVSDELLQDLSSSNRAYMVKNAYSHFANKISDDEIIVISRPMIPSSNFLLAFIFIGLIAYAALSIMALSRKRRPVMEKTYYRTRVTTILVASLVLTMVTLALVSVLFVYRRNDANRHTMMVEKISSVRNLLESRCRNVRDFSELSSQEFTSALETVSDMTGSDIMLYTPTGVAFKSTTQEVLDNMLFGSRIDADAFQKISYDGSRYFIKRDMLNGHRYYSLYAPVCNDSGQMLAIASSPYIASNYDFETEAIIHTIALLCVFLILMFVARILIGNIVDRMFKPLSQLGNKMGASNVDSLEYLEYDKDDEITSLVQSYNKMVSDLSDSTRKLAQAERDKAWSGMARQVAHEIKNPLTPMKLQLQRLIRLKQKGDPHWQDIFDEVAKVVLDHIDILSETANEFSTFAKLYTEEPTEMDLDLVLQEEIAMFDNRENIKINYMGLRDAKATGPKPQLTRVFVNLINNAIQAVEEQGGGTIQVSLRNSSSGDGFYDIVFEDSGPGVASENVDKLFTPNFTTKSSGTGLGLAISRSILERCGARISYSRSFVLGGACFTIVYPK